MSTYYSFELHFPSAHPFDKLDYRWPTFVGEFLRAILENDPSLQCCASYYGKHAELYIYTDDSTSIQRHLSEFERRGFKTKEMNRTLEENFGGGRFLGPESSSTPTRRAKLILASLRVLSDLLVDSVSRREDGYWEFEKNVDAMQNPTGTHFFSVLHLFHLITQTKALIYPLISPDGNLLLLDYYTYVNNEQELIAFKVASPPQQCMP